MVGKVVAAMAALALAVCTQSQVAFAEPVLVPTSEVNASDVLNLKSRKLPARPKIGLALGGGGARGAAEVGVLEVLQREGIKFDCVAGTSIGSIIGGLYIAGVPVETLRQEFENGRAMRHFMPVPMVVGVILEPALLATRLLGRKSYDGIYPGVAFRRYLDKVVPQSAKEIQSLPIPYAAVTLNLLDGKPYMVRGGSLVEAMRASSAVPGLRRPIPFGDKLLVDGGVVCNVPVKQCRELGADIVIAVNIDEPLKEVQKESFLKLGSVAKRMLAWDLHTIDKPQEELADIVIHPDTAGVTLVTTSKREAKRAIAAGRKAAEDALPAIRAKLKEAQVANDRPTPANSQQAATGALQ